MILELCMKPRTKYEIAVRLGMKTKDIGRVVKSLMASDELLLAVQDAYISQNQMLVSAQSDYKDEVAFLEFSMTERSGREIAEYFRHIGNLKNRYEVFACSIHRTKVLFVKPKVS